MNGAKRRRVLFVAEAVTLAHVVRPLVLARALPADEFDVHFACAEGNEFVFQNTDSMTRWPIRSISSQSFLAALATGSRLYEYQTLMEYIEAEQRLLEKVQPDLVIGDFRISLAVSARLSGIPYAALANAHWSPYTKRQHFPLPEHPMVRFFGVPIAKFFFFLAQRGVFYFHARPLNAICRRFQLPPVGNLLEVYTHGDYTLYTDLPAVAPTHELPGNDVYLGPIVWSPEIEQPPWWNKLKGKSPLVYVTLGSSGQVDLLPIVVEALGEMDLYAMVATAGRVELKSLPPNVWAAPYLPGTLTARRSAVVICNGGSATVYQALKEQTPVLGIASNMDQYLTMQGVSKAGAGILLRAGKTSKKSVRRKLTELLCNEQYRSGAKLLANEFSHFDAGSRFLAFLLDFFDEKTKVGRQSG